MNTAGAAGNCVQIYYDRAPDGTPYTFGRVHAMYLQNLLGHFPKWRQVVLPMEKYQRGDVERCEATFYVATHYAATQPAPFLEDYTTTKKRVVWMGYGIWKLDPSWLAAHWGLKFLKLADPLPRFSDLTEIEQRDRTAPGFYKFYEYKGETFTKYGDWDRRDRPDRFVAASEIALFEVLPRADQSKFVVWARHSDSGQRVPYVVRDGNRWYIGESPFSFMTEDDRYVVFADLLFDMLGEQPRHRGRKPALVRFEDIHPRIPAWQIRKAADLFHRMGVKFAISLIPVYTDPLRVQVESDAEAEKVMSASPEFVEALEYARKRGAAFILHGFTHQLGKAPNPFNGLTGDDFEFWDRVANQPVKGESVSWGLGRLEDALYLVGSANRRFGASIEPAAWLTPHYQCSPLMCALFGQAWSWTIGRNIYFVHEKSRIEPLPVLARLENANSALRTERLDWLKRLSVVPAPDQGPNGQFFPYEIYGDVYGQRVIPENVGNVQPYLNEQVLRTRSIAALSSTLKRNRILRDAWGSWFVHPFHLNKRTSDGLGEFPGDTRELEKVIRTALDNGYEFIDLKEWVHDNRAELRPEPIERER